MSVNGKRKQLPSEEAKVAKEGSAVCSLGAGVFYNKVQVLNRDLSILFVDTVLAPNQISDRYIEMLEAFGASGLRTVRYARELRNKKIMITVNDIDSNAVKTIRENLESNGCSESGSDETCAVTAVCEDAEVFLSSSINTNRFNVIDIDPYGSPSPFMDTAVKRVGLSRDSPGYLMITATDANVLCGHNVGSCLARYGSINVHGLSSCHEVALRILLYSLQMSAAKASRCIEPVLSLHLDFYFRLFVRVIRSASRSKLTLTDKIGYLCVCQSCQWFTTSRTTVASRREADPILKAAYVPVCSTCPVCGESVKLTGPIWTGELHDKEIVQEMIEDLPHRNLPTQTRISAALELALQESREGILFFDPSALCKVVQCQVISAKIVRSALVAAGFEATHTHCDPKCVKTNAPMSTVWKIIQQWAANQTPGKQEKSLVAQKILSNHIDNIDVADFTFREDAQPKVKGIHHLHTNPEPYWGPIKRAKLTPTKNEQDDHQ